jgi:hypothetical protein
MANPDANYPVCKTRGQDHCRVASQMARRHAMAKPDSDPAG